MTEPSKLELPLAPDDRFTALDWIGVVVTGFEAAALLLFPLAARAFGSMYRDLGGPVPALTRLVLSDWLPVGFALLTLGGLKLGLRPAAPIARRRAWIVGAFALGGAGFAVCLTGLYLPIFRVASLIATP